MASAAAVHVVPSSARVAATSAVNPETATPDAFYHPQWDANTKSVLSTTVTYTPTVANQQPLYETFRPQLMTTYRYDQQNNTSATSPASPASSSCVPYDLSLIGSRMSVPGNAPLFRRPPLPLRMIDDRRGVPVSSQPIIASLMALRLANIPLPLAPSDAVTFFTFRHAFRQLLMDKLNEPFSVDIQRHGALIVMRKYLSYSERYPYDIGHQFEVACTQRAYDGDFCAIVRGKVGAFNIVTTAETDVCMTNNTPTAGLSTSPPPLQSFTELKCIWPNLIGDSARQNSQWLQCTLGGAHQIVYGLKRKTSTRNQHIEVYELQSYQTEQLSDGRTKDVTFNLMHEYMKLIAEKVEQGKVYKLERAAITSKNRSAGGGGQYNNTNNSMRRDVTVTSVEHRVTLSEVIDGDNLWPIVNESIVKAIDEWALSVQTQKAKQSNINVVKQ